MSIIYTDNFYNILSERIRSDVAIKLNQILMAEGHAQMIDVQLVVVHNRNLSVVLVLYRAMITDPVPQVHLVCYLKSYNSYSVTITNSLLLIIMDVSDEQLEIDKIIGKRLGIFEQMEYLAWWMDCDESESTWQSYDDVKRGVALREFEAISYIPVDRIALQRQDYIYRKWSKNKVQQWQQTLVIPSEFHYDPATLLSVFK